MKILIFSVAYHPFVGGAEIAVKEITDRIKDVEFHLITVNLDGKQKREEQIGNVHVYRVGAGFFGKLLFPFLGAWKGLALHKELQGRDENGDKKDGRGFDVVWSIMANYAGFAALFFKYLRPSVPFILTLQEGDPIAHIKRQVWFIYPLFVQIFRRADKIQAISNYLADFARNMGARAPIRVIPNGVDVSLFSREYPAMELEKLKNELVKKMGDIQTSGAQNPAAAAAATADDDVLLVTSSRLVLKNGIADVIQALSFLPNHVKFLIIGVGPLEYSLKKLSRELNVQNRVIFAGFVNHTDLPKYLQVSDIFVRPSLSEGMGNSFIEAMASGIPVIATPIGGIPDFLTDGETGIFCEIQNPKSIAEKVGNLLSDSKLRETLILNARNLVREKYDWNLVANNMKKMVFFGKV